jgi:hypothetical protein
MSVLLQDSDLEALRYQLETVGYVEVMLQCNFEEDDATLVRMVGKELGATIPVPPDSTVVCNLLGAVFYNDDTNAEGEAVNLVFGGFRDGTGNPELLDEIGGNGDFVLLSTGLSSEVGASASMVTVTVATDNNDLGINLNMAGDADADSGYFMGRAILICAKNGGLPKAYTN